MGWIGSVFIIIGAWHIGRKRRWAFLLTMFGGACWICEGVRIAKPELIMIEAVMFCVALRSFLLWRVK